MRFTVVLILAGLALAGGVWLFQGAPDPPSAPAGGVEGRRPVSSLAVLTVEVQDRDGIPLGSALVTLLSSGESRSLEVDPGGIVLFERLGPGEYVVEVEERERPALRSRPFRIEPGESAHRAYRLADFQDRLHGRVIRPDGTPVAGIRLEAERLGDGDLFLRDPERLRAVSDAGGAFAILDLEQGKYSIRTRPARTFPATDLVAETGEYLEIVLEEGREVTITGRIRDPEGSPVAEAEVIALGQAVQSAVYSQSDGAYAIPVLFGEEQRDPVLVFRKEGFRDAHSFLRGHTVGSREEWPLDVQLEPDGRTAAVAGVVTTTEDGPLRDETVRLVSRSLGVRLETTTEEDGFFIFSEVPLGEDYRLWINPRGDFVSFFRDRIVLGPEGRQIDVRLEPIRWGVLYGEIVNADGDPVPGLELAVLSPSVPGWSGVLVTDDRGSFDVVDVPAGELVLERRAPVKTRVEGILLDPRREAPLRLVLDHGPHHVSGQVVDPDGAPVPRARVDLSWSHREDGVLATSRRQTFTDEAGEFRFDGLGAGAHRLQVVLRGHRTVHLVCRVGEEPPRLPMIPLSPR